MKKKILLFTLLFCFGLSHNLIFGQPFTLLKDINSGTPLRAPTNLTEVNGVLFFSTRVLLTTGPAAPGNQLWKSDGTETGTVLVKELPAIDNLVNVNGVLFFTSSLASTQELWKSDGSDAGTVLVKSWPTSVTPGNLTVVGNILFLTVFFSAGEEMWKSDGSAAGTQLVKTFQSGIDNLTNVNGTLFFSAGLTPPLTSALW